MKKKKNAKKAIHFSLMVCGASGTGRAHICTARLLQIPLLGKTTFVNTLCGQRVLPPREADDEAMDAHLESGLRIKPVTLGDSRQVQRQRELPDLE